MRGVAAIRRTPQVFKPHSLMPRITEVIRERPAWLAQASIDAGEKLVARPAEHASNGTPAQRVIVIYVQSAARAVARVVTAGIAEASRLLMQHLVLIACQVVADVAAARPMLEQSHVLNRTIRRNDYAALRSWVSVLSRTHVL